MLATCRPVTGTTGAMIDSVTVVVLVATWCTNALCRSVVRWIFRDASIADSSYASYVRLCELLVFGCTKSVCSCFGLTVGDGGNFVCSSLVSFCFFFATFGGASAKANGNIFERNGCI